MMNLKILMPCRKQIHPGDIFVLQIRDGEYIFGRVIATDAKIVSMNNCILIYIYRAFSDQKDAIPVLSRDQLLVPPIMTNRLPWSKGFFESVAHTELKTDDILPIHCFVSLTRQPPLYYNEHNHQLSGKIEPCGIHALKSYKTIDDAVSKALGIPLYQDE